MDIKHLVELIDNIRINKMMAFDDSDEWAQLRDLVDTSPLAAQNWCIAMDLLSQAMHTLEIADLHLA